MLADDFAHTRLAVTIYKNTPDKYIEAFTDICYRYTGRDSFGSRGHSEVIIQDFIHKMFRDAGTGVNNLMTIAYNFSHDGHLGYMGDATPSHVTWYAQKGLNIVSIDEFLEECTKDGIINCADINTSDVTLEDFDGIFA